MSRLSDFFARIFGTPIAGPIEQAAEIKKIGTGDTGSVVLLIQNALKSAGHDLHADGEFGPITDSALRVFQAARKLPVTGYVDVYTARALDGIKPVPVPHVDSIKGQAPWLAEMRAITGTKEVPGDADSPIILSWRDDIIKAFPEMSTYTKQYKHDATPWCGLTVAVCVARHKIKPAFGPTDTDKFLWAQSWAPPNWGTKLTKPIPGCIMTFGRSGGGHVAILEELRGEYAMIRGGNQSDMVNVTRKKMEGAFIAAAWPPGWPIVETIRPLVTNYVESGSEA